MALSASRTLPAPVERITSVFTDEAFIRHTSEHVGGELKSVVLDGDTASAFSITVVRTLPTNRLPEMARKVLGESLTVTQIEQWAAPEPDGSRTAEVAMKIAGAPVKVDAVQRLVADDGATRVELEGTVSSSVPFMGPKIAEAAEPVVAKALNIQAAQAENWMKEH